MSSADALLPARAAGAARVPGAGWRLWKTGVAAAVAWAGVGGVTLGWPNVEVGFSSWGYTREFGVAALTLAVLLLLAAVSGVEQARPVRALRRAGPWLVVLAVAVGAWEIATAKLALLPSPFFAPPQSLIEVYVTDYKRLADSLANSLWLLSNGFLLGAAAGFLTGVAIGWSRGLGYWVHPVLRFLGPVPSTALLPMAFFFFPSSWSAAVFLIALATWFPVTVLTWSGVAGVNRAYYDVARTMGANEWFLVLRVAIPAALPQVFVGLFMGLGASFSVLVAAEMMGVKSGLGWYLSWAQGWASYANMYGALIVMALVFSGLITLLFLGRDRLLAWQKGVVKW
ncbi:ABC transporter permease [Achromobacter pestifer]